jgi:peptidoglycan/LPS O-acetylase OafA/YrhL
LDSSFEPRKLRPKERKVEPSLTTLNSPRSHPLEPGVGQRSFLDRFKRITSSHSGVILELDGLRFFAIWMVVVAHTTDLFFTEGPGKGEKPGAILFALSNIGIPAVKLFFSISGFILAMPFLRHAFAGGKKVELSRYYRRRVSRLEPPYIIAMTVWLGVHVLIKGKALLVMLPHYFASIFYCHYFIYGKPSEVLWAAWSLEIEVQFYLLAPFLFYALLKCGRWRRTIVWALIGASLFFYSWASVHMLSVVRWTLLGNIHYFLLGFLFADRYLEFQSSGGLNGSRLFDLAATVAFALLLSLDSLIPEGLVYQAALVAVIGTFFWTAFRGTLWARILRNPIVSAMGGMCYTFYLFHRLVLSTVIERFVLKHLSLHSRAVELGIVFGGTVAVVAVLCGLLFLLVERPFMAPDWTTRVASKIPRRGPN